MYFETEFGDRIAVSPFVEKRIYPEVDDRLRALTGYKNTPYEFGAPARFESIAEDVDTFSRLMDFLDELDLLPRAGFRRALDIAGGEGIHASLLRGLYARVSEVVDIRDGSDPALPQKLARELGTRYRRYRFFDWLLRRGVLKSIPFYKRVPPRMAPAKHLNRSTPFHFYNYRFKRTAKVDRFIVSDWLDYTPDKPYDFIMNFQSFWLFDHDVAFRKISSMLEPGGLFAVHAPYHWAGRPGGDAGGGLGGGFAFFEQRLTLPDIKRYYAQFKPELAEMVETGYLVTNPKRPTIPMYVESALRNGLAFRGYTRIYHRQNYTLVSPSAGGVVAPAAVRNPGDPVLVDVDEVLRNIHRFRPDVGLADLLPRAVVMVFQRPTAA